MLRYAVYIFLLVNLSGDNSQMLSSSNKSLRGNDTIFEGSFVIPPGSTIEIPYLSSQLTSFGRLSLGVTTEYPDEIYLQGFSGSQELNIRVKRKFAWETYQFRNPLFLYNPYPDVVKVDVKIVGTPGR